MQPIRILQVATVMNRGGLETMLMNYYRKLDRTKVQFDFLVNRFERGHYDDEIEAMGGRIYRMPPIRPWNYARYARLLDKFFAEHPEYRVVHSHINENSGLVLRAANKAGIPCRVAHSHLSGLPLDYKAPFRLYGRLHLNRNATALFACSEEAGVWLFGADAVKERGLVVFKNAVDCQEFAYDEQRRAVMRAQLGLEGKFVVGHVGRFNPQKNHEFLLDIFAETYKRNPNAVLLLVGEGHLKERCQEKAARLGLGDAVRFLGLRGDIPALMQAMDVFLFPSLFEGTPVALIEAQAAGLPCIASTGSPSEADVTGAVEFLGLDVSAAGWAEAVLRCEGAERLDRTAEIAARGYDAARNIGWLVDYYAAYYDDGRRRMAT